MESVFKIGDCVTLKSGGPTMTIEKLIGTIPITGPSTFTGRVECKWFVGTELSSGQFHQDALELNK
ncbi:MAG: YodC family protein [Flavobacterium sp.]|jgi:uncharacterized protein YodC (DUF2158 family)